MSIEKCLPGECIAGIIANKFVAVKDWEKELTKFEGKIELWNALPQFRQIPHIGYISKGNFCTVCGRTVNTDELVLDKVEGDILPVIGESVEILLGSSQVWEPNTVVGYYVWGPVGNSGMRVFIRVRNAEGTLNARLLGSDSFRRSAACRT